MSGVLATSSNSLGSIYINYLKQIMWGVCDEIIQQESLNLQYYETL